MKIKHYDKNKGEWVLDGASNASQLELTNPAYSSDPLSIDRGFTKIHQRLNKIDQNLAWIYLHGAKGGGGEGGTTTVNITLTILGNDTILASNEQDVVVRYNFQSNYIVDNYPTGPGIAQWRVNELLVHTQNIQQGDNSFNLKKYLKAGNNTVQLTVKDTENNQRTVVYNITVIELKISSSFDYKQAYTGTIPFIFTPIGNISKTVHFLIDGTEVSTLVTTASNRQVTHNLPAQSHGSHILEVHMTTEIEGQTFYSNTIKFDLITIESGNTTPIIASSFNKDKAVQYDVVNIEYVVYDPTNPTPTITLKVDDKDYQTITVDRNAQIWNYRFNNIGNIKLSITLREVTKDFNLEIEEADININPVTDDLVLHLTSAGRSNNELDPSIWEYNDIKASLENFNFTNNGWILKNQEMVLRINSDARVNIPYKLFGTDFKATGKTIEFEFSTSDISNYDTTIISCMSGNVGLQINAQDILFKSEQSQISAKFKEDEKVRISFVIEKVSGYRLILAYINGIISGITQYPIGDSFKQFNPVNIVIGSDSCTTDIYNIRVYDNNLTWAQVLENYTADLSTLSEKQDVYNRNNVYDIYGRLDFTSILNQLPCMTITGELPKFKGDIKTVDIEFTNLQDPSKSFKLRNAQIDVQGTSSVLYPRFNYVFYPTRDFELSDGTTSRLYTLKDGDKAARMFCIKADYMESSGTHNTGLSTLANDTLKSLNILTPPQRVDSNIRTSINGYPVVIFHRPTSEDDRLFYGKYNFNHDKEAEEVFGFTDPLVHESWEFLNNTSPNVLFKTADFTSTDPNGSPLWVSDFSARYPKGNLYSDNLRKVCAWVASTQNDLNKFRQEVEQHFNLQNLIAYYVFTEIFGMVDQRAKNQFITSWGREQDSDEYIWYFLIYDSDTGLGLNNEGVNRFSYNIEYGDKIGNASVWNGSESVLWNNLEKAFKGMIEELYQQMRLQGILSYEKAIEYLNLRQSNKWNEVVYNSDAQFKYIDPAINDGNTTFMYAGQGSRVEHRKWWLYNRFRYLDSKYNIGDFIQDFATLRIYTPDTWGAIKPNADITVTPYADQYVQIKYGSYITRSRGYANQGTTIKAPENIEFNDTETVIYGASRISSLGDLSPLYPGTVDVTKAIKLKELIIGNQTAGYRNTNMHNLSIGNNKLLRKLDISNCPELIGSIDLTGCENIEEIYAHGSGVNVFNLSTSGILNKLYLPSTITNLTLQNQLVLSNTGIVSEGFSNIGTVVLDNLPNINVGVLLNTIVEESTNLQRIRAKNLNISMPDLKMLLKLMNYSGIDDTGATSQYPWLTGRYVANADTTINLEKVKTAFPYLDISVRSITTPPTTTIQFTVQNLAVVELESDYEYIRVNNYTFRFYEVDGTTINFKAKAINHEELIGNVLVTTTVTRQFTMDYIPIRNITVKDNLGAIISGAEVKIVNTDEILYTDSNGQCSFRNKGSVTIIVSYSQHSTETIILPNSNSNTSTIVTLQRLRDVRIILSGDAIPGVTIYLGDITGVTDRYGEVILKAIPGTYNLKAVLKEYETPEISLKVGTETITTQSISFNPPVYLLKPKPNNNIQLHIARSVSNSSASFSITSSGPFSIIRSSGETKEYPTEGTYTFVVSTEKFGLIEITNSENIINIKAQLGPNNPINAVFNWGNSIANTYNNLNSNNEILYPRGYLSKEFFKNCLDITTLQNLIYYPIKDYFIEEDSLSLFEGMSNVSSLYYTIKLDPSISNYTFLDSLDIATLLNPLRNSVTTLKNAFNLGNKELIKKILSNPTFANFNNITTIELLFSAGSTYKAYTLDHSIHPDLFKNSYDKIININSLFKSFYFEVEIPKEFFNNFTNFLSCNNLFGHTQGIFPIQKGTNLKINTGNNMFERTTYSEWLDHFDLFEVTNNSTIDNMFFYSNIPKIFPSIISMLNKVKSALLMFYYATNLELSSNTFTSDFTNTWGTFSKMFMGAKIKGNKVPKNFINGVTISPFKVDSIFSSIKNLEFELGWDNFGSDSAKWLSIINSLDVSVKRLWLSNNILMDAHTTTNTWMYLSSNGLSQICLDINTPPVYSSYISIPSSCIWYVPDDAVDIYKTATGWSSIKSRIKGFSELPELV